MLPLRTANMDGGRFHVARFLRVNVIPVLTNPLSSSARQPRELERAETFRQAMGFSAAIRR